MSYTPNPDEPTEPVDEEDASTAAAEFRALKLKLNRVAAAAYGQVAANAQQTANTAVIPLY